MDGGSHREPVPQGGPGSDAYMRTLCLYWDRFAVALHRGLVERARDERIGVGVGFVRAGIEMMIEAGGTAADLPKPFAELFAEHEARLKALREKMN